MANCFIIANPIGNQVLAFAITDTKLYVPLVTVNSRYVKQFQQLKLGFKRTISWNNYRSKAKPIFK